MTVAPPARREPSAPVRWWAAPLAVAALAAALAATTARRGGVTAPRPPPFLGPFPPSCAWSWSAEAGYTYSTPTWSGRGWRTGSKRPAACDLPSAPARRRPPSPPPSSLATAASCTPAACTFTNLWHADGAWYALVNGSSSPAPPDEGWAASAHVRVRRLRVTDPTAWAEAAAAAAPPARTIPGTTALLDYRFFLHPTAIGHWAEAALGLGAALRERGGSGGRGGRVDRLVVLHAPRSAAGEWVRTALVAGLAAGGPTGKAALPPLHFQAEAAEGGGHHAGLADPAAPATVRARPGAPLEGVPPGAWLRFETVVVPREPPPGTPMGATVGEGMARDFRAAFWRAAGTEVPARRPAGPNPNPRRRPAILFLAKASNRRVLAGSALASALTSSTNASSLTVASFTDTTPVAQQLAALAGADLVVGPHTSALAAAALLPPGAALLELLPWGWAWGGLDATFSAMARALGDVEHASWRGTSRAHVAWADGRDAARFGGGGWGAGGGGCATEACVEAVTRADVVPAPGEVADAAAALLASRRG